MHEKIDILFIQSQIAFGADSLIHAHLMRELDRSRFRIHVACTAGDGADKPVSLSALEKIPDISLRRTTFAPGFSQRSPEAIRRSLRASIGFPIDLVKLLAYMRRHRIRIVHATEKPRDAVYAVTLGRLAGAKSVAHVHVKWSEEYSRGARWAVQNADAAFGISRYVSSTIIGMGKAAERVHTILNSLDAEKWNPSLDGGGVRREFGIDRDALVLASVSRLFSWKGQRELISAMPLVRRQVPGVRLLIVGEDEPYVHGGSFTSELKVLAKELGVAENVVFTGPRRDIPQVLAASDLYTMPSFEEPFGVVFLEAMAMKKAVVAIDNGGTPEVVENGKAGLLSPPWDVPALASNIIQLLTNRDLRLRMGEYGRARTLDYFNPKRMAAEAAAAYEAILRWPGASFQETAAALRA